jgi:hypothetical protein
MKDMDVHVRNLQDLINLVASLVLVLMESKTRSFLIHSVFVL